MVSRFTIWPGANQSPKFHFYSGPTFEEIIQLPIQTYPIIDFYFIFRHEFHEFIHFSDKSSHFWLIFHFPSLFHQFERERFIISKLWVKPILTAVMRNVSLIWSLDQSVVTVHRQPPAKLFEELISQNYIFRSLYNFEYI